MVGDLIKVITNQGTVFGGFVHVVESLDVGLHFHTSFPNTPGQLYDVDFSLCRVPLRRMHQALKMTVPMERLLFPTIKTLATVAPPPTSVEEEVRSSLYNTNIADNAAQLKAVASVMLQPPGSAPFVVFGP